MLSFWPHALHSECLLGMVEAEKGRLTKTQHTACKQVQSLTVWKIEMIQYVLFIPLFFALYMNDILLCAQVIKVNLRSWLCNRHKMTHDA